MRDVVYDFLLKKINATGSSIFDCLSLGGVSIFIGRKGESNNNNNSNVNHATERIYFAEWTTRLSRRRIVNFKPRRNFLIKKNMFAELFPSPVQNVYSLSKYVIKGFITDTTRGHTETE